MCEAQSFAQFRRASVARVKLVNDKMSSDWLYANEFILGVPSSSGKNYAAGAPESQYRTAMLRILKQSIYLLYAEVTDKSTKNSYLILFLSKGRLKHHRKSETLSVNLRLKVA